MPTNEMLPIACSLAPGALKDRVTWIGNLNAQWLRSHRRDGLTLHLTYAPEALAQVSELVRHEQDCCGFLRFVSRQGPDSVELSISAPPEAGEGADTLLAYFLP
jgi:hypothetical protein